VKLSELLAHASVLRRQGGDPEIRRVVHDSREIGPGDLFVAIRGLKVDGHTFLPAALAMGAAAAVVEDPSALPPDAPGAVVSDTRVALALAAAALHGDPTLSLALAGVTGTNGKTTTTYLVEAICREAGGRPGVVGTVGYRFAGRTFPAPHTTPDPVLLQGLFAQMRDAGITHVAMEVSSHALEQRRVDGCHFRVAAFTNLTQDHLDFHGTMEAYFAAKKRLFTDLLPASRAPGATAVVSIDDPRGPEIAKACRTPVLTTSVTDPRADVRAAEARLSAAGIEAVLETPAGRFEVRSPLVGAYNLQNLLCATGIALALGLAPEGIAAALATCRGAPGRLERVPNDRGIDVFVDYAHTGDALGRVLDAVRAQTRGRLIAVFGCGGDRDRGKRPIMGSVAARHADLVVVTSDNPRTEDPLAIIAMILPGVRESGAPQLTATEAIAEGARGYVVEPDRRAAIRLAVRAARPGDSVVIAGKGHEDYQILGQTRIHFDDREEARAALEATT
jgi:UDP-N-acetylmuramoyl-L-alanyl-D-glutamate--2,6-diaminopimelate ligase